MPLRGFFLCVLSALSPLSSARHEEPGISREGSVASPSSSEQGSPALFAWADFDGDARLDLAAVSPDGRLLLLSSVGGGRFEDVTERAGLAGIANAALALWADYDGDLRLDLFVGAREGASRILHNEGGLFVDASEASGLEVEGAVRFARWLDCDGDGRPDLHVVTAAKSQLFHGLEGGFFERTELPPFAAATPDASSDPRLGPRGVGPLSVPSEPDAGSAREAANDGPAVVRTDGAPSPSSRKPLGPPSSLVLDPTPLLGFPLACASSIRDQANPGSCLEAATTPTLGRLYPISANLFVAVSGDVGIGTTSPTARLHVTGTARITDTLTLAPAGDTALDVSTGSIYKGGALFLHTQGGPNNTALGRGALSSITTGFANTASGVDALSSNTGGFFNTASGAFALSSSTTGVLVTAHGAYALSSNTTGDFNTASGAEALRFNTTGFSNTAHGAYALRLNTTGLRNTASGARTLVVNTTGFDNTASGYRVLNSNTYGGGNTGSGVEALRFNTTGYRNTASGRYALRTNTIGNRNAAFGAETLFSNTTGYRNTAFGDDALFSNTTGNRNLALGQGAGFALTTGSDNIDIGHAGVAGEAGTIRIGTAGSQTRAFLAGIRGVTTGVANAIPVLIDSAGQLGTVSSSARFKQEIRDMGELTERLLELRPVVFRYRPEVQRGERPLEYGLIAEEVADVFPELVVHDEGGEPFTVKYHLLASMLLNELQALDRRNEAQERELRDLHESHERLEARLAAVESRDSPVPSPALATAGR